MKKLPVMLMMIITCCLIYPLTANADVGPKPTLKVMAKNMPDTTCYLDLLVDYAPENMHQNITDVQKYDQQLLNQLKLYHVDGWRPAMATGTMPPLFGDILCDIKNGECILHFSYTGIPDRFKIIVVSADGKTVVSNQVKRKAFNSTVHFDYQTGRAAENSPIWAYLMQFLITCSATLIIEGLILIIFRFNLKQNWKPFMAINIFTQILLTLVVFSAMYKLGTLLAILLYVPFEIVIMILEAILFARFLKQHSITRRVIFSFTANIVSFGLGFMLMLSPYWSSV